MATPAQRALLTGAIVSSVIVVVWVLVTALNPTTTYHFAPIVAAAAGPAVIRWRLDERTPKRVAALGVIIGLVLTALGAVVVSAAGWLLGPPLIPAISVPAELVLGVALGAVIGAIVAIDGARPR